MKTVFNQNKPRFLALVNMLMALAHLGVLKTVDGDINTFFVYKNNLPLEVTAGTPLEGKNEGWVTENVFSVAQYLFDCSEKRRDLLDTLQSHGIIVVFTSDGELKEIYIRRK